MDRVQFNPDQAKLVHLAFLIGVGVALSFAQTHYLGWHADAFFPFWRAMMVSMGLVIQLNSAYQKITVEMADTARQDVAVAQQEQREALKKAKRKKATKKD